MFKFFKKQPKINWKYIIGEILLIFVGISLAIGFNNWNDSKKIRRSKGIAIEKIVGEIESNSSELNTALINYERVFNAYSEYKKLYNENTSELLALPEELKRLQLEYPGFYTVKDSVLYGEEVYKYVGSTKIELELPVLTEIAWRTTVTTNISTELNFECMYNLESVYTLQRKVGAEIDKATEALQKGTIDELISILGFLNQLGSQLQKDYLAMRNKIKECNF